MTDSLTANSISPISDVGVDEFLIDVNRDFDAQLLASGTAHDYRERPGVAPVASGRPIQLARQVWA